MKEERAVVFGLVWGFFLLVFGFVFFLQVWTPVTSEG